MALRDEIIPCVSKLQQLTNWIETQKNADEWRDVIFDSANYSGTAVAALLSKYGFKTTANVIHRYRAKYGVS